MYVHCDSLSSPPPLPFEYSHASNYICSVHFISSRVPMRTMHQAVETVLLDVIFPSPQEAFPSPPVTSDALGQCLLELQYTVLNENQKAAVRSMLDPTCSQVRPLMCLSMLPPLFTQLLLPRTRFFLSRSHHWCWVHLVVAKHVHCSSV